MPLVCSSSFVAPWPLMKRSCTLNPCSSVGHLDFTARFRTNAQFLFVELHKLPMSGKSRILASQQSFTETSSLSFDWEDQEDLTDSGSPWEGAVVYKRNASVTHVEYCTTLESVGLGRLSTEISRSRASSMGVHVTKVVKDFPDGTPVQVSIDVIRKKKKLRLDGIVRTVITLGCNRCGEPAAETVFSNLSLLLMEEPVEEPEIINLGFAFGNDKGQSFSGLYNEEDGDKDDSCIDLDDQLHFPAEVNEIDISKHVRDLVHLEITINAICDPGCKGICLKCGTNLNKRKCNCSKEEKEKGYGPLGNLRKQMLQKEGLKK
ncbi:PREDICTED: uncharacterized protein LOC104814131 [Tarenaya hassleriana]|uniref:uncharacterized protein LOC104814131 n=1 Tax=Tarenaya hassleriana TaxID=28532 RepID=UPI00053C5E33|nr:PREDICTED: uncharacterized protein LOC104814131 [Tarenaya hassleriana]XP_010540316.1 PREDICTED: uncharacterized protein LOC104814131 [Tarenaya hassleriana]